jgi:phosphoribosylanthranilate isomerase
LDSGTPNAKLKRLGGTGKVHNWDISRKIVQSVNVPVYLAGGLNPENVYSALNKVLPHGVDICSGIRTQRKLDEQKLKKFMNQIYSFESEYSYKHDESSC